MYKRGSITSDMSEKKALSNFSSEHKSELLLKDQLMSLINQNPCIPQDVFSMLQGSTHNRQSSLSQNSFEALTLQGKSMPSIE